MLSSVNPVKSLTIDVAVVNWNTAEAASESSRAYLASAGAELNVTIVDNASEPEERAKLERLHPEGAELILSEKNLGFGAGANRALRDGDSEFVCVSNADVVPEPDAIAILAAFCDKTRECGMVGPAFVEQSAYHARLPKPTALALRPLIGGLGHHPVPSPAPGKTIEVEQPAGACFVVRREVWERLGGFDEGYFLWYEDVDLARRLRDGGLRNFVCGSARVHHSGGLAIGTMSRSDHQAARLDGLDRYLRKFHPRARQVAAPLLAVAHRVRAPGSAKTNGAADAR
ncbi:MAG TPA: glycosyltransferase family 2 protein [Solirubrobacterales bacterium]